MYRLGLTGGSASPVCCSCRLRGQCPHSRREVGIRSHPPAMHQQSPETAGFELVGFGWELSHLLRCNPLRGTGLCHLCPASDLLPLPPYLQETLQEHTHKPADKATSPGHTAWGEPGCCSLTSPRLQHHGPLFVWLCTEVKASVIASQWRSGMCCERLCFPSSLSHQCWETSL